jgi:uncharacterized UBP type Zn finger protein
MNGWHVMNEDDRDQAVVCGHLREIPQPSLEPDPPDACRECVIEGTTWVALRTCLQCGHTGCCDSSSRRHATEHFQRTAHPTAADRTGGSDWAWCYADQLPLAPDTL